MSNNISYLKSKVRNAVLEKRNALPLIHIAQKSDYIQEIIINSKEFRIANVVGGYVSKGSEVRTQKILKSAIIDNKTLALPKIVNDRIIFRRVTSMDFQGNKLVTSRFGTKEPPNSANIVNNIDTLIVPGIAFDKQGYRLGYGKGFYDKYLARKKGLFTMGLAFEFQLLENDLPHNDFDQKLNALITESRIIYFDI